EVDVAVDEAGDDPFSPRVDDRCTGGEGSAGGLDRPDAIPSDDDRAIALGGSRRVTLGENDVGADDGGNGRRRRARFEGAPRDEESGDQQERAFHMPSLPRFSLSAPRSFASSSK